MTFPNVTFWAFRYALGRATYAVGDVIAAIRNDATTGALTANDRATIIREIGQSLHEGRAGHPAVDAPQWAALKDELETGL